MASAANQSGYGNPGMGGGPWGPGAYGAVPGNHPWEPPDWGYRQWLYASRPLWLVATILGFIFFWPLGLILLGMMIWSRRMGCWGYGRHGGWQGSGWQGSGAPPWAGWKHFWTGGSQDQGQQAQQTPPTSGNRAFDEYRAETLRRLEEEQKEFATFLERLRFAKDKAEFDQFMAELRQRPPTPQQPAPQA